MSTPILATKLYIPPPRADLVFRTRLIQQLNEAFSQDQGFSRKLTLISAPAGFGKTTLISSWINDLQLNSSQIDNQKSASQIRVAWLSLDEADNDPTCFMAYLVAALQTIFPTVGGSVSGHLQSSQSLPIDALLTMLLNELADIADSFILVLDDYHIVDTKPVDAALSFLLDHLPPQMHIVVTTREDPDIPLARLRARSQLAELRVTDLRFTLAEATDFLNQTMGLNLSTIDVATLDSRTEGWIAGLQLAALALQGQADPTTIIQGFSGNHRFVLDFLVEEVLQQQPEHIRNFLLQTAVLDRLSGPLCDAVTSQMDGQQMLENLERGNLFLIPLDNRRQWYRYHHLFTEVLQAHMMIEQADQISTLHQRASKWFEQNNQPADAIRHALASEDFEQAAGLIELAYPEMGLSYQGTTWLGWVKALPDDLVRSRPVLNFGYAGA